MKHFSSNLFRLFQIAALALGLFTLTANAQEAHTSTKFMGAKANTGAVTHTVKDGRNVLTLSDDFKVPDTPAPHWQVVDSQGNSYLLQRLQIKDKKYNKQIVVPAYIKDISKVQIWCAFAEVLLGEAGFASPVS